MQQQQNTHADDENDNKRRNKRKKTKQFMKKEKKEDFTNIQTKYTYYLRFKLSSNASYTNYKEKRYISFLCKYIAFSFHIVLRK